MYPTAVFIKPDFDERHHSTVAFIITEVLVSVMRQRLWFEPHWHAAALLLCVPARNATMSSNCNVAQWIEQADQICSVEGSTPSIATT